MRTVQVTYIQPDGARTTCELRSGESVMDGALDNEIPGILGQCGGACTCATCHCYVPEPYLDHLAPPHRDELELLGYVHGRRSNSRLACQIFVDDTSGDLTVEVPARQA